MQLNKAVEIVFSIVVMLFLAVLVMGILIGVTIIQEMSELDVDKKLQFVFIFGMALVWIYLMRAIAMRIKDYYRYI